MTLKIIIMRNRLYNINRWLDNNESFSIILLLTLVFFIFLMPINKVFMCTGIIAMLLILFKIKMGVFVVFDKSKYNIPIIGEIITVTSDIHTMSYIGEYLFKGVEYTVYDVVEQDDDWIIFVCNEQINKLYGYRISYMQHKKYFTTKSDIRNKKLDKLLK
jgi:uncharacterized membrane protein